MLFTLSHGFYTMIHFWNIQALARDLATDRVSERLGMLYFLAGTIVVLISVQYSLWWGPRRGWLFFFEFFVLVAIAIAGCISCWRANGADSGQNFVLRTVCLSVPAGVRVSVLGIAFGSAIDYFFEAIFGGGVFADPERAYDIVGYAVSVGFGIYYWYLVYNGLTLTVKIEKKGLKSVH